MERAFTCMNDIIDGCNHKKRMLTSEESEDLKEMYLKTCMLEMFAKHALKVIEDYGRKHESEYAHH